MLLRCLRLATLVSVALAVSTFQVVDNHDQVVLEVGDSSSPGGHVSYFNGTSMVDLVERIDMLVAENKLLNEEIDQLRDEIADVDDLRATVDDLARLISNCPCATPSPTPHVPPDVVPSNCPLSSYSPRHSESTTDRHMGLTFDVTGDGVVLESFVFYDTSIPSSAVITHQISTSTSPAVDFVYSKESGPKTTSGSQMFTIKTDNLYLAPGRYYLRSNPSSPISGGYGAYALTNDGADYPVTSDVDFTIVSGATTHGTFEAAWYNYCSFSVRKAVL